MIQAITHGEHGQIYTVKETTEEQVNRLTNYLNCLQNDKKFINNKLKKLENHIAYVKKDIESLRG